MTTEQLLIGDHYLFATEVINSLNRFYGIPVRVNQRHEDDCFFNNDIRWGIITISYLFRKDFHRIYDQIKNKLKNKQEFENYCMLITVSKNDRYFFNFLRRVALIYEIAVCCYRNGKDYFSRAKRCIMWYQDKLYFRSAGSWPSLNKTASFLRTLGNPLLRVILEESSLKCPLTFSATVDKIEQRLIKSKNLKTSKGKEFDIFRQQQKKFLTSERDEKESSAFQIKKERAYFQCLKSILRLINNDTSDQICSMKERHAIIEYLVSLILPEISNKLLNKNLSSPEHTSTNVTDLYEPFEELFQSKQESDGQEIEKESSTVKKENESTSSAVKGLSLLKRPSYMSKNEETEISNSEFIAGDLFSSSSEFDKFSQLYSTDDSPERTSTNVTDLYEPFQGLFQSKQESDGQEIEKESSTVKKENGSTSSAFKCLSLTKRLSNISKNEETETSNSESIAEDLFPSSSTFNDEFSQLYSIDDLINDNIFLNKYINLSKKLNRPESTLSSNSINFLCDRTNSLEMPKNEIFPEYSFEGKNVPQSSNKNDHLDSWKDLQNSCSLSSDSKSQIPSSSVDAPKIVSAEQAVVNDDKQETGISIDDNEEVVTIRMGPYSAQCYKKSGLLHVNYLTDVLFTPEEANTIADTNIPTEINTNNSETDPNEIVDRSLSNSQHQRYRGKRNSRKKKGKKK